MSKEHVKIEYRVTYEPNPEYDGDFQRDMVPGLHGTFVFEHDAKKAAKACKDWFNLERSLVKQPGKDGRVEDVESIEYHDNVIVTISKHVGGSEEPEGTIEWDEDEKPKAKAKGKKELATV